MTLHDPEAALAIARAVVERVPTEPGCAVELEVTVETTAERFVRFADTGPTQCADRERTDLAVRLRLAGPDGRREARASGGGLAPADAAAVVERALALARVARPDPELLPLGGPVTVAPGLPRRATADHGFDAKARWVALALARCREHGLAPAGLARTCVVTRALASTAGRAVAGATSRAAFSLTATAPDGPSGIPGGSGLGARQCADVDELDPEVVVTRAVEKAVAGGDPRPFAPAEVAVVLEPHAVSALLLFAAEHGFGARAVEERASFLCDRAGERALSAALTIADDAADPRCGGWRFDGEGSPRERVVLVDAGVPTGPVTDRAHAARMGLACTGHGPPQPSSRGPRADDLVVLEGGSSTAELVAGLDRGLLVTQLHYTNLIDPRELLLTGMTRNGTFQVERGEVVGAVKNLRFTQSLVAALARVCGVGRDAEAAGALFEGQVVAPALRIDGFRFTSTTDF